MRIAIGSDHAGFSLKGTLLEVLRAGGHEVVDVGTDSDAAVDYPDYAEAVAVAVRRREVDRGVMICGSGVGASVAANKVPGVRAAICHDTYSARQGVEHDDLNVLVLGGRVVGATLAVDVLEAFLGARFSTATRHRRRVGKIRLLEGRDWSDEGGGGAE